MSQKETHVNATEPRVHINQLRLPAEPSSIQSTSQGGHPPLPTITPELMQEMWAHEPIGLRRVAPPSERWAWQAAYLNNALRDPNRPRACCDVTPSGNIIDEDIAHPTNEKEKHVDIYNKFCVFCVERTDGSSAPNGKPEFCEYFVLDLNHDRFARPALLAYASACQDEYPAIANDLYKKVELLGKHLKGEEK